ncbi:MAG: serine hydrolase [Candidatus Saccharimonadaceae bacterium]
MQSGKINPANLRHSARRAQSRIVRGAKFIHRHGLSSRRRIIVSFVVLLVVPIVLVQLFYPDRLLLPNTTVGSVQIGGDSKLEATEKLDKAYEHAKVPVYFTDSDELVIEPSLADVGVVTSNEARVAAYDYPLFWRLIPGSLFWYQAFMDKGEPAVARNDETFAEYMVNTFGVDCEFKPTNGTIAYIDGSLQALEANRGGSCDINELTSKLKTVSARLAPEKVTVTGTSVAPEISTKAAQTEYERLIKKLGKGVALKVEDKTETIPAGTVAQWIEYSAQNGALSVNINAEKSNQWLKDKYGKKFTSDAGVSTVTTKDFAEATRETGKSGQSLNTAATATEIANDLNGKADSAKLIVDIIEPTVVYQRTYSSADAALSAVMKKYADSHPGTYGVKLVELSGARRNAEYNSTKQFTTASTYKLFVAYSILLRIERGDLHWTDGSYGGYNLSTCFDRMIMYSDNECAVNLLNKATYTGVTNDAHAIGANTTTFSGTNGIKSTASDEALLLSLLYSGQILNQQTSREKMITAMKGNVYVKGIPSGIPNVVVADKVGFLDALLHDAAIVYSPKGTFVLIILTDNASWANIAELAKELEAAR